MVLRDIQGLGFDTLSWFKDRSQWLNVSLQLSRSAGLVLVVGHTVDFDSFA